MKNARIVLAIIILVLINYVQTQSNHKAAISFDCDKYLGFYFQSDTQETVGHVTHMKISDDTELQNDLVVKDPLNYPQSVSVVGVLDDIYWEGSYADPIQMNFLVSTTNKNYVTILVHSALSNTNVFFDFNVYSYDPIAKTYFKAFSNNMQGYLLGLIEKQGADLQLFIDDMPDSEVMSPLVYMMTIGIMPQEFSQELLYAVSQTQLVPKPWGIGDPPPPPPATPTLISPSNSSTIYDQTPTFDWNNASGATSYTILVDNNSDFSSPVINQSPIPSTYTPGSSLGLGTYYWKVLSINDYGSSDYSSTRSFTIGQLSAPTNITSYVNGNDITFDWDDVPGATGYQIYSTADPYGMSFDYEATVYVSQYTVEIIDQKKFYYIIAIME